MSFTIVLQKNISENNAVTKSLTQIASYSGTIKDGTSLIDPIFLIECNLSDVINVNYITVATFGRSYFVKDVRAIRTGLVEFSCHVDVLSSFASQIRDQTAIINRQQNKWNLYLNDGSFKVYQNPIVVQKKFPTGFSGYSFVMLIAGKQESQQSVDNYVQNVDSIIYDDFTKKDAL